MKVIMVSRTFPAQHPKAGQPTWFVEKIWKSLYVDHTCPDHVSVWIDNYVWRMKCDLMSFNDIHKKLHTIRANARFAAGDMASLRVWSGKPYRSKQVEFAQVEVRRVIPIYIADGQIMIDGNKYINRELLAKNDGLSLQDFIDLFAIHPKKTQQVFTGQIICWQDVPY